MSKYRGEQLTDQLRQAMDDSGLTRYRIAKEIGISQSSLSRFYNGRRGLSMEALNALAGYLGLQLVRMQKPGKKEK